MFSDGLKECVRGVPGVQSLLRNSDWKETEVPENRQRLNQLVANVGHPRHPFREVYGTEICLGPISGESTSLTIKTDGLRTEREACNTKSEPCILIGFSECSKAYRMFNPKNNQVLESWDMATLD